MIDEVHQWLNNSVRFKTFSRDQPIWTMLWAVRKKRTEHSSISLINSDQKDTICLHYASLGLWISRGHDVLSVRYKGHHGKSANWAVLASPLLSWRSAYHNLDSSRISFAPESRERVQVDKKNELRTLNYSGRTWSGSCSVSQRLGCSQVLLSFNK